MENQAHLYDDLINAAIDALNISGVFWFSGTRQNARALCNRAKEILEGRLIVCHSRPPEWEFLLVDQGIHGEYLEWMDSIFQQRSALRNSGCHEDKLPIFPRKK